MWDKSSTTDFGIKLCKSQVQYEHVNSSAYRWISASVKVAQFQLSWFIKVDLSWWDEEIEYSCAWYGAMSVSNSDISNVSVPSSSLAEKGVAQYTFFY